MPNTGERTGRTASYQMRMVSGSRWTANGMGSSPPLRNSTRSIRTSSTRGCSRRPSWPRRVLLEVLPPAALALVDLVGVGGGHLGTGAGHLEHAVVEPGGAVAHLLDRVEAVGDHHDGDALLAQGVEVVEALALELGVADGDDLVDDEDLGVDVDGDGEAEAHEHAARVDLHRRVDELLDAGEGHDVVVDLVDLLAAHPEDGGVHVDVLAAGEVGVEPGAELEQRGDAAVDLHRAAGGLVDAGDASNTLLCCCGGGRAVPSCCPA